MDQICMVVFLPSGEAKTYDHKPLMLQKVLFCPVLSWCARVWVGRGIRRFFVVCDEALKQEALAFLRKLEESISDIILLGENGKSRPPVQQGTA